MSEGTLSVKKGTATPTIMFKVCTMSVTVYNLPLPADCQGLSVRAADATSTFNLGFVGTSVTLPTYITIPANTIYTIDSVTLGRKTIYLNSVVDGITVQLMIWK